MKIGSWKQKQPISWTSDIFFIEKNYEIINQMSLWLHERHSQRLLYQDTYLWCSVGIVDKGIVSFVGFISTSATN